MYKFPHADEPSMRIPSAKGEKILIIGNLFSIFSMATAFLGLGFALREMYHHDYKMNRNLSWFLTSFVPLGLVVIGINNFIVIISLVGSLVAGIDGILIISMWLKAKKFGKRKPEYSINLPPHTYNDCNIGVLAGPLLKFRQF